MPVVRISEVTWERLKTYARPLEDTADDVIQRALDALDAQKARHPQEALVRTEKPKLLRPRGNKLPQKEFRKPLLLTLDDLGGTATVSKIRETIEPRVKSLLKPGDYSLVSTGEPRWWNAVCWERAELVREGLIEPSLLKGVWALSLHGKAFVKTIR